MVDALGGGLPGAPGPSRGASGMGPSRGLGILLAMMQAGLQEYDWAIGGIVERAKSTLGACAIVLSVLIAGIGGFAWILNSGDAPGVMEHLRAAHAIVPVALLGSSGLVALIWSAHFSVAALSVVEVKSPFSTNLIMEGGAVSEGTMRGWESAGEAAACRSACKSYAVALENRESAIEGTGPKAILGQRLLLAGLGLTASATIVTLAGAGATVGAWPSRGEPWAARPGPLARGAPARADMARRRRLGGPAPVPRGARPCSRQADPATIVYALDPKHRQGRAPARGPDPRSATARG